MKILLIGYGRMGKEVHQVLTERGHEATCIIDLHNKKQLSAIGNQNIDVAIEFTRPNIAFDNVMACISENIPVVTGTTGWNERLDEIHTICKEQNGSFLYASNFSIGVNMLFAMNKKLASLMNSQPQYNAHIEETHHIHKKDKPSGTAITLAEQLTDNIERYNSFQLDFKKPGVIPITANRKDEVFGDHKITYTSPIDELTIAHSAKSRKGFALGAVIAAEHIAKKKGIFTMNDVLGI
ncbi:MAG: 4-hydroxy-tetrahydrodipicolinate reductase [Salinivirgaceae bacterium]|jgi:4-hydroxy-tetrahydrodipicolinate reductase|nr:4-hydroxy-tetrahydrodipicolinate reductase [Salinivirgaceae bacterium]